MNLFVVDGLVHGQPEVRTRVNKRTNQNENYAVFTLKNTTGYGDFKVDQYFKVFGRPHHVKLLTQYVKDETALIVQGTLSMKEVQGNSGIVSMAVSVAADQINFPAKKPARKNADGSYGNNGGNYKNSAAPAAPPAAPPSTPPPAPPGQAPVPVSAGATALAEGFQGTIVDDNEDDVPF